MKTSDKTIINGNDITSIQTYDISFADPLSDIVTRLEYEKQTGPIDHYNLNRQWSLSGSVTMNKRELKNLKKWLKKLPKVKKCRIPRKQKRKSTVIVARLKKAMRKHYQRYGRPEKWSLNTKK